jgi:hypothetical protein
MIQTILRSARGRMLAAAVIACAAAGVPAVALASSSAPAVKPCTAPDTYVWFGLAPNGAAGTIYYPVEFSNTGSKTCTLRGFPGVAAITKSGKQLGKAAARFTVAVHTVTLKPNQTAHALIGIIDDPAGVVSGCHGATAYGFQVYPPGQARKQLITDFGYPACTNKVFMHLYPVQSGVGVP